MLRLSTKFEVRRPSRSEDTAYLVHVSCLSTTTVSQLFEPQLQNLRTPGLHFLFALGTPLWKSRKTLHKWKDNSVLAKLLAACIISYNIMNIFVKRHRQSYRGKTMYRSIFNTFPVIRTASAKKIAVFTYRSPHFCFPWRRPCDYHAICCMDGKTIQCLPNPSQHVPIYIQ